MTHQYYKEYTPRPSLPRRVLELIGGGAFMLAFSYFVGWVLFNWLMGCGEAFGQADGSYLMGECAPLLPWEFFGALSEHPDSEAQEFCQQANALLYSFQLCFPTEAQWEYSCRAGTSTPFSLGNQITTDQANYDGDFPYEGGTTGVDRAMTVPVSKFHPNPWGLYQMHGNVWEWCADWYGDYPKQAMPFDPQGANKGKGVNRILRGGGGHGDRPLQDVHFDPKGADQGKFRVLRGGGWYDGASGLRSGFRNRFRPDGRDCGAGLRLSGIEVGI